MKRDMVGTLVLSNFLSSFSLTGIVFGVLVFAASLTPSLIPRPFVVQGLLSGVVLMVGYAIGWTSVWLWSYLGLSKPASPSTRWMTVLPLAISLLAAVYALASVTEWQNSTRALMNMEPVSSAHPFRILAVAVVTALVVLTISRFVVFLGRKLIALAERHLPQRVAILVGLILLVLATFALVNDVILSRVLLAMDETFAELNDLIEPDIVQPEDAGKSGSEASFLDWSEMGRRGREFIVSGPSAADISRLTTRFAKQPLRVYAGFSGEENLVTQADLALKELLRLSAFERSVLIVATPTGTGWLDPAGVDTVEYLHGGDTAIVALQYSYLPSWTTLLIDPDRARRAARILFQEVYDHWRTLPEDGRPKLYLFGLSLGALGSENSANMIELLNEPFDGAVWCGPPFPSTYWGQIMRSANLVGPAWLPELPDERLVRFSGPEGYRPPSRGGWGRSRILYIQHASDPMTFFSPDLLWSSPSWLIDRGPDVSPDVRWWPLILFFQVGFDIFLATNVPVGHGHNFAPGAYIDGWIAVTNPDGWGTSDLDKLRRHFRAG